MQWPVQHSDELIMEAARLRHPTVVSSLEGTHGSLYEHNGDFDLIFGIAQVERTAVCDDYAPPYFLRNRPQITCDFRQVALRAITAL